MISDIISVFDNDYYAGLALSKASSFQSGKPFRYAVFDDFLPSKIARKISRSYPVADMKKPGWKFHNNKNTKRYFLEDTSLFDPDLKAFSAGLCSRSFLLFLETLTGIKSLQADPYFLGGGAMATGTGGFLNSHVDYNYNQKIQSWRRLNFLIYLTENWEEKWEGNLQLLSENGVDVIKEIVPLFNRAVVFETNSKSFHGQSEPLKCPENTYRTVFSAFYHANEKPSDTYDYAHYTYYNKTDKPEKASMDTSPYAELITNNYLKKACQNK